MKKYKNFEFCSPMGFEYSVLPTKVEKKEEKEISFSITNYSVLSNAISIFGRQLLRSYRLHNDIILSDIKKLKSKLGIKPRTYDGESNCLPYIHDDNGSIEINSPIAKNLTQALSFFDKLDTARESLKLKFYDEEEMSGGLHIHFDVVGKKTYDRLSFIKNAYIAILNRPYLNWVFNDPNDDINARSFLSGPCENSDSADKLQCTRFLRSLYSDNRIVDYISTINIIRHKDFSIRHSPDIDTIEFRFFDMVKNRDELYLVFNFCDKFIRAISENNQRLTIKKQPVNKTYADINKAKEDFNILLLQLNLNPKDYAIFVKRNLEVRYQLGKEYLT